ncbi:hypothetical protein SBG_2847 [Salmonella bongori NCTC 12419]|uniref:Uncharacterized protein n=1 Tax=Salmonella bongori (strain ATCC 43975 / DSM 13772 / NCTC 12419) TaxID=218493 RepID=A0A0K0HET6_SALBC|nr:hypothetical protein SBG_2847 [Salmonella bongori NCTC 12419]
MVCIYDIYPASMNCPPHVCGAVACWAWLGLSFRVVACASWIPSHDYHPFQLKELLVDTQLIREVNHLVPQKA